MISIPYIFLKDFNRAYFRFKECELNKKKFLTCMNKYIFEDDKNNCRIYHEILKKYKCIN